MNSEDSDERRDRQEARDDRQAARDDSQAARDDSQAARDDRQEARDESLFTREDLDPLAVQVKALRQDLHAYRWAIEKILRRRMWTSIAAAIVGLGLLVSIGIGAKAIIGGEEERSRRTLELARLESCATVRALQAQVVAVLANLPPDPEDEREWLASAIERLSVDPCTPASETETYFSGDPN